MLTGVAWDHMNVFPTWENYVSQFEIFADKMEPDGALIWFAQDEVLAAIAKSKSQQLRVQAYESFPYENRNGQCIIKFDDTEYPMQVFGDHNLQNMKGALLVCQQLGIEADVFLKSMMSFKGAAKRLQLLAKNEHTNIYLDFAHSPSKLKATTEAVKKQFSNRKLVAVMELHTFSSLNKDFLPQYAHTMDAADQAFVYFNPEVIAHKKLPPVSRDEVHQAFNRADLQVFTSPDELVALLKQQNLTDANLLIMTSGNLSGVNLGELANELINN